MRAECGKIELEAKLVGERRQRVYGKNGQEGKRQVVLLTENENME